MSTRIGAALMIVLAVFLISGQFDRLFAHETFSVDYTIAAADGSLVPLVVD